MSRVNSVRVLWVQLALHTPRNSCRVKDSTVASATIAMTLWMMGTRHRLVSMNVVHLVRKAYSCDGMLALACNDKRKGNLQDIVFCMSSGLTSSKRTKRDNGIDSGERVVVLCCSINNVHEAYGSEFDNIPRLKLVQTY